MTTEQNTEYPPIVNKREIWEAVCETDPRDTKSFQRGGGFRGTALNPTAMADRATTMFGPMGEGWGVDILDEQYREGAAIFDKSGNKVGNDILHIVRVELWYIRNGKRCSVIQYGQTFLVTSNKHGPFTDEEAPKKSLTDGMTKCLSLLGFGADIHRGYYDDNKYVNDVRAKFEAKEQAEQEAAAKARAEEIERLKAEARDFVAAVQSADDPAAAAQQALRELSGKNWPQRWIETAREKLNAIAAEHERLPDDQPAGEVDHWADISDCVGGGE